ncbi:MAG: hypothetical protein FJ194_12825 [Gammaproteobacteria bacterium]|nr:hypothetical protein [Gammaproteobacteria bacterium]
MVQPHPDVADTLRAVRITGGARIENPSRLILPQFALVSVAHADGRVDHEHSMRHKQVSRRISP